MLKKINPSNFNISLGSGIDHICINLLVPSVQRINIGNPGNQVNYGGGGGVN